jgi:hypothetical protein
MIEENNKVDTAKFQAKHFKNNVKIIIFQKYYVQYKLPWFADR